MTSPVRLAIVGAQGRMGQRLVALGEADPRFEIAATIDAGGDPLDACSAATIDAVIDFSVREQAVQTAVFCMTSGIPLVLGTTGLSGAEKADIATAARSVPMVMAPNFSVGVNALFALAAQATPMLGEGVDIEVVEAHHRRKVDAPSGTAVRLAEILAEARGWTYEESVQCGREGQVGARPDKEIGMSVVRGGDVVGEHTVTYYGPGERLSITHRATDRDIFVRGALRAAAWAAASNRAPGLYDMADVLQG